MSPRTVGPEIVQWGEIPEWYERARCRPGSEAVVGLPFPVVKLFYPTTAVEETMGVAMCLRCPVQEQCAARGRAQDKVGHVNGTWGGVTEYQRTNPGRYRKRFTHRTTAPRRRRSPTATQVAMDLETRIG